MTITAIATDVASDATTATVATVTTPAKRTSRAKVTKMVKPTVPDLSDLPVHTVQTYSDYLISERNARIGTKSDKPVKTVKPRKGELLFIVDEKGKYVDGGTFTHKAGPTYIMTQMDSNGRHALIVWNGLELVVPGTWVKKP